MLFCIFMANENVMRKFLLVSILIIIGQNIYAQPMLTPAQRVKTILIHQEDAPISAPIIQLDGGAHLEFSFDYLHDEEVRLHYRLVHCNPDGSTSSVSTFDFVDGFADGPIEDVEESFNTLVPYYHYKLQIPNDNARILLSGRYRVEVFPQGMPDSTVASATFFVYEDLAQTTLQEYNRGINQLQQEQQHIELTLTGGRWLQQPEQLNILLVTNYDYTHPVVLSAPDEITSDALSYRHPKMMKFSGGNEFRSFNTNSTEYANVRVQEINYHEGIYHFLLRSDKDFTYANYESVRDIDGRFQVDAERRSLPSVEADYAWVYFSLPGKPFVRGERVVLLGGFNQWSGDSTWTLPYSFEHKAYERRFLLKQGYYNYCYGVVQQDGQLQKNVFSGNYAQTGNTYQALVFYRPFGGRYARLIGFSTLRLNSSTLSQ